jgi:hypothetical protein
MLKIFRLKLLTLLIASNLNALAQGQGNNPYSVLGIGELADETVAAQDMMGGTGVSFTNSFYVNHLNPALLVKNRTIGFTKYVAFDVGFKGGYKTLTQGTNIQENFGLNLNNLTMAFPIKPKWAMSVSLRPYAITDFTSRIQRQFEGTNVQNNFEFVSKGSISKVAFTNSFEILKNLYLGIEGQYLFGTINKDTTSNIAGTSEYFRNTTRLNPSGHSLKAGLAYQYKLNKKWKLNAGGIYQLGSNLSGENLRIFSVLAENGNGPVYIQSPDTISISTISTSLPSKYKIGLSLESTYHWLFAAEYGVTQWNGVKQFDAVANNMFSNATELNLGAEWIPNSSSSKYLDQAFYRVGFRQVQTPYTFNSQRVKDTSFSLGMSLPMAFRNPSYIDLAVAFGRRGTNENGGIRENYTKISVNFSLLSSWFNKPRID